MSYRIRTNRLMFKSCKPKKYEDPEVYKDEKADFFKDKAEEEKYTEICATCGQRWGKHYGDYCKDE